MTFCDRELCGFNDGEGNCTHGSPEFVQIIGTVKVHSPVDDDKELIVTLPYPVFECTTNDEETV